MYKLVASDMDATILVQNEIPKETVDLIEELYQKGVLTALVTGRMWKSPQFYAKQFSFPTPVIACNGALIFDGDGKKLAHYPLSESLVRKLVDFCHTESAFFQCYNLDALYLSGHSRRTLNRYSITQDDYSELQTPVIIDPDPCDRIAQSGDWPAKFVIMDENEERLDELRREVEKEDGVSVAKSHYNNLEITRKEATKGIGLRALADHLGIAMEEVVTIGDHENDVSMFEVSGLSIAVEGNSDIAVKYADVVTQAPHEGGWAKAIRKHVLEAL